MVGSDRWAPHRGGLTVEDGRSLNVAYPRGMSDLPQLLAAIDGRLADLAAEITALETARAALDGPRTIGRSPAGATDAMTARSRRRPRRPRRTPSPKPTEPAASATTPDTGRSVASRMRSGVVCRWGHLTDERQGPGRVHPVEFGDVSITTLS